jgi:hypothetical protein
LSSGISGCTGGNTAYTTSGSKVIGTWEGFIDSIIVTQVTTLDTNALYFSVDVTFINTAVAPKNNLYYLRSVDPDNDETWAGGGFPTHNIINYQMPDTFNVSAVTATGYSTSAPALTLGTTDTASRAVIYNSWPIALTVDLATVYALSPTVGSGTAYYNVGVDHPGDIAIGLIINIPHLATVDSAGDSVLRTTASGAMHPANQRTIHYFYAFGADGLDSAVAHGHSTGTSTGTLAIKNVNNTPSINIYPNPAHNIVNIAGVNSTDRVALYDMMGRQQQNWEVYRQGTNTFSLNGVSAGAYVVVVSDANGNVRSRTPLHKY